MKAPIDGGRPAAPGVPRVVELVAAVGLVLAANRIAPGVLEAVLLLVALYALLTYSDRASQLIGMVPGTLRRGYSPS